MSSIMPQVSLKLGSLGTDGVRGGNRQAHSPSRGPTVLSLDSFAGKMGALLHQERVSENSRKTHIKFIPTFMSVQAFGKDHLKYHSSYIESCLSKS